MRARGLVRWLGLALLAWAGCCSAGARGAEVSVTNVAVRQRHPGNGLVEIDYELVCGDAQDEVVLDVTAVDTATGKAIPVRRVRLEGGAFDEGLTVLPRDLAGGRGRLVWDARADAEGSVPGAVEVEVKAVPRTYPGNAEFRNLPVTFAAQTRTDWVTNATVLGAGTDPGVPTPIDWSAAQPVADGIDYIPAVLTTNGGWPRTMVCHFVRVDLSTPNLRFTGTDRCPDWGDPMPEDIAQGYDKRTVREKTSDFIARNRGAKAAGGKERDAVLAWNNAGWTPWISPYTNLWGAPDGPLYSDGIQVSGTGTGHGTHGSAESPTGIFVVYKDGAADIIPELTADLAKETWFAVPAFKVRLVSDGRAVIHDDTAVAPRTAIGLSQDRKHFYLVACDGRRNGWSQGCDFPSLSALLVAMGCQEAVNLDGGGSTTLCGWDTALERPSVLNRPSSSSAWSLSALRDNGANAAIYFKAPAARLGTWIYDDFGVLLQDIADGETPSGETAIDVLGDATFTAEHPFVPAGTYSLSSTNGSSIGWEEGVAPAVAAGTRVTFRGIRFRGGSRTLSVASGGTAVIGPGADLDGVETRDRDGLVIAGELSGPLRVSCAAAADPDDVFATSTLPLAAARTAAASIVSGADDGLIAVASGTDGDVSFSWARKAAWQTVTFDANGERAPADVSCAGPAGNIRRSRRRPGRGTCSGDGSPSQAAGAA